MAGLKQWLQRRRRQEEPIYPGRQTEAAVGMAGTLSPRRSRVFDILDQLRSTHDEVEALDFLRKVSPDVSMAVWNFVRLANLGHEMHFYRLGDSENRLPEVEKRWEEFASRVNHISNAGLDALIDQLHYSAFMRAAQAVEVEVARNRREIVDIYPIRPQTIEWEIEERNGRKIFVPYQIQGMKRVSLENANFFWVPTDPDIDDPRGNLIMGSVIQAIDFQMQILNDLQQVIHNQGFPRYDLSINLERVLSAMPAVVKADPKKHKQWLEARIREIRQALARMEPDESFVHFDDVGIQMVSGANQSRSLDVRAITEMLDQQAMSGAKQLSVFMNRNTGVTETWGTVQFRIFSAGIASIQRGSKRIMESVARLWLRVNGIQAVPKFKHNTVDWQSEEQRIRVKLMTQEFWAIAQLMGWVDADKAAQEAVDAPRATGSPREDARVTFQRVGGLENARSRSNGVLRSQRNGAIGGLRPDTIEEVEEIIFGRR